MMRLTGSGAPAGFREKVLVHIDAHDDLAWARDAGALDIGNFISLALKEGIIREVFWVVPDQTWESSKTRQPLLRRLKRLTTEFPGASRLLKVEEAQISLTLLDKPVRVCTLDHLPPLEEKVLLDIDTDFFTIPRACSLSNQHRTLPWCWPGELVARLKARGVQADLITIAYSVEGGYTPVKWKYLADELSLLLDPSRSGDPALRGLELTRAGAQAVQQGDLNSADNYICKPRSFSPARRRPLTIWRTCTPKGSYRSRLDNFTAWPWPWTRPTEPHTTVGVCGIIPTGGCGRRRRNIAAPPAGPGGCLRTSGWENRGPAPALAGSRGLVKKIPGPERPAGGCLPLFGKGADQAGAPTGSHRRL